MRATETIQIMLLLLCMVLVCGALFWVSQASVSATVSGVDQRIATGSLTVTSPVAYRVFQRDPMTNVADIHIEGTYTGEPASIEASWNGGAYQVITISPSQGIYAGTLAGQPAGQGSLMVRFAGRPDTAVAVDTVGIGDIFIVAGQSNAVGHAKTLQQYESTGGITATLFGNDDMWKELTDPYDSAYNQVDSASADRSPGGSFVPRVASAIVAQERVPVAFVPTARGGTVIEWWQPGTPLYESMKRRIAAVGGTVRAVLWFQGEGDAGRGTSYDTYTEHMDTMIHQLTTDFPGTRIMVGQIGQARYSEKNLNAIRQAQSDLWGNNPHVLVGPTTKDIDLHDEGGDGIHFSSDADMTEFANRWWQQLQTQVYTKHSAVEPFLTW